MVIIGGSSWRSYPSIFALGHKATQALVAHDDLLVEEKMDGSQFSFGVFDGHLRMKSKNQEINPGFEPPLFAEACETVKALAARGQLTDGWTYRSEAICKPKHNVNTYARIPVGGLVVYDINTAHDDYMPVLDKQKEARRLGLEVVPVMHRGRLDLERFKELLNLESFLGGCKIEGVVIKPYNYDLYGTDKKVLMGKFVGEEFKELHREEWGAANPKGKDIVQLIAEGLRAEARWHKAVQGLKEAGTHEGTPRDIGPLLKAVSDDLDKEVTEEVKDLLFKHFWKDIKRSAMRGIPEWYKFKVLAEVFEPCQKDSPETSSPQ